MVSAKVSDVAVCAKYEARRAAGRLVRRALGRNLPRPLPMRVSVARQKQLILRQGFAVESGKTTWFYSAPDRGDMDPLTNYSLAYLVSNIAKDARILVTGCGTGLMAFYLSDQRFTNITGLDLLPECIAVATEVQREGRYGGMTFAVDDCLQPTLDGSYEVVTALHWVFSAWMGNYGNEVDLERAFDPEFREHRLSELLSAYAPHMREGGQFLIELTDAVTDYRLPEDHPLGQESVAMYPVRLTPDQVDRCANAHGLDVIDKKLCVSFGHHPRTLYVLQKRSVA